MYTTKWVAKEQGVSDVRHRKEAAVTLQEEGVSAADNTGLHCCRCTQAKNEI